MKYLEDDKLAQWTGELTDAALAGRVINGRIEAFTMKRAGNDKKYAHQLGERFVADLQVHENQLADYQDFLEKQSKLSGEGSSSPKRKRSASVGAHVEPLSGVLGKRSMETAAESGLGDKAKKIPRSRANSFDSPVEAYSPPSLGDFQEIGTRRLMCDLILCMNSAFPDYDFGNVKASNFSKKTAREAMDDCNGRLSELASQKGESFLRDMWNAIDSVMCLAEVVVFSYAPPAVDEDPLGFLTQTLLEDDENPSTQPLWSFNYFFVNKQLKRILLFSCIETMKAMEVSDEEDEHIVPAGRYKMSEINFDMDPSSDIAGGIPIDLGV